MREVFDQAWASVSRKMTPTLVDRIGHCYCATCDAMRDADRKDAKIMLELTKAAKTAGSESRGDTK